MDWFAYVGERAVPTSSQTKLHAVTYLGSPKTAPPGSNVVPPHTPSKDKKKEKKKTNPQVCVYVVQSVCVCVSTLTAES